MITIHSHRDQNIGIEADPRCFRYCQLTKNKKYRRNEGSVINMLLSQTDAVFYIYCAFPGTLTMATSCKSAYIFFIFITSTSFFSIQYYPKIKTLDAII